MKRPIITLLAIVTILVLSACGRADSDKQASQIAMKQNKDTMAGMQHRMDMQNDQQMEMDVNKAHAMVQLPTVQCDMCKESIEQGLATLGGILSVHIDLEDKMAEYRTRFSYAWGHPIGTY
jgi:hypothetical protein